MGWIPMTAHKWAEVIHAFADGKEIEWKYGTDEWLPPLAFGRDPISHPSGEWRIKPEKVIIRYRRYIVLSQGVYYVWSISPGFNNDIYKIETFSGFIRWIDTEWQEEEI
jgi:hypothetical protein